MLKRFSLLSALAFAGASFAQAQTSAIEIANLHEDVRGLNQRVGDLSLRLEQLEAENAALRNKAQFTAPGTVTAAQLDEAVADMNRTLQAAVAAAKADTLQHVAVQMEKLARETNAAIESISKNPGVRPPASNAFSADFSKEGITYTVQKGDTLELIAKKTGSKSKDIVNANKIADPSRILIGQSLFIPGGK